MLASEIHLDDGIVKGVRHLGGRLEFGETWRDDLMRQLDEELGVSIWLIEKPIVLENIHACPGMIGHEVAFVSDAKCPAGACEGDGRIEYLADNGEKCLEHGYGVSRLDRAGPVALNWSHSSDQRQMIPSLR